MIRIVTLDGSAGSGKGTISKKLSQYYEIPHIDNGRIFRALALVCHNNRANLLDVIKEVQLEIAWIKDELNITIDGVDVSDQLVRPEISMFTAELASSQIYFKAMVEKIRNLAYSLNRDFISDGRAVGSYIFPEAEAKFYIYASPEIRAARRHLQLKEVGIETNIEILAHEMFVRDELDKKREFAPLTIPENAHIIETENSDIESTLELVVNILKTKYNWEVGCDNKFK